MMKMDRMLKRLAVFLALVIIAASDAGRFDARVVKVKDGDSFEAIYNNKLKVGVRLFGVDAPEHGQPYADAAREFTTRLIYQKTVAIIPHELDRDGVPVKDRYGRVIARVMLPDGRCLNDELVKAGLAWWYRQYAPDDKKLEAMEALARSKKLGLWALEKPAPVPPWDWRHQDGSGGANGTDTDGFCASRNSTVYHRCSCPAANTIDPKNLIRFKTEEEAKASGRRPCKDKR